MKKLPLLILCAVAFVMAVQAQPITKDGGLSMQQINMLRGSYQSNPTNKALRNAINSNDDVLDSTEYLGLNIARTISCLLDSKLTLDENYSKGLRFSFVLKI